MLRPIAVSTRARKRSPERIAVLEDTGFREAGSQRKAMRKSSCLIHSLLQAGHTFVNRLRDEVENIGWPLTWEGYVSHASSLGREGFRDALEDYRRDRPKGDKKHRRITDVTACSISPQKLFGTPVALMFFEGAHRLVEAGVTIPGLQEGDPDRIVVEAYPGVLARSVISRRSYKNDTKRKQTEDQHAARRGPARRYNEWRACHRLRLSGQRPT